MNQNKHDEMTQQEVIDLAFGLIEKMCTSHSPSEDQCRELLEDIFSAASQIDDSILADNFEARWVKTKRKIQPYADPSTFRFYELEIEKNLNKILAPARMEL